MKKQTGPAALPWYLLTPKLIAEIHMSKILKTGMKISSAFHSPENKNLSSVWEAVIHFDNKKMENRVQLTLIQWAKYRFQKLH
jgi:hypothetical protein